jgi:hypothetical protein
MKFLNDSILFIVLVITILTLLKLVFNRGLKRPIPVGVN